MDDAEEEEDEEDGAGGGAQSASLIASRPRRWSASPPCATSTRRRSSARRRRAPGQDLHEAQEQISNELMNIRLHRPHHRAPVRRSASHGRPGPQPTSARSLNLCVDKGRHAPPHFIKSFLAMRPISDWLKAERSPTARHCRAHAHMQPAVLEESSSIHRPAGPYRIPLK